MSQEVHELGMQALSWPATTLEELLAGIILAKTSAEPPKNNYYLPLQHRNPEESHNGPLNTAISRAPTQQTTIALFPRYAAPHSRRDIRNIEISNFAIFDGEGRTRCWLHKQNILGT
jgi:hypothetical protein